MSEFGHLRRVWTAEGLPRGKPLEAKQLKTGAVHVGGWVGGWVGGSPTVCVCVGGWGGSNLKRIKRLEYARHQAHLLQVLPHLAPGRRK